MAGEDELQNEIWLWRGGRMKKHCERYAGMVRRRVSREIEGESDSAGSEEERCN